MRSGTSRRRLGTNSTQRLGTEIQVSGGKHVLTRHGQNAPSYADSDEISIRNIRGFRKRIECIPGLVGDSTLLALGSMACKIGRCALLCSTGEYQSRTCRPFNPSKHPFPFFCHVTTPPALISPSGSCSVDCGPSSGQTHTTTSGAAGSEHRRISQHIGDDEESHMAPSDVDLVEM